MGQIFGRFSPKKYRRTVRIGERTPDEVIAIRVAADAFAERDDTTRVCSNLNEYRGRGGCQERNPQWMRGGSGILVYTHWLRLHSWGWHCSSALIVAEFYIAAV